MARIRTIKPDFWSDETLGECSPTSRLLFIGTWNVADDHGNLERSARQLKAQLFPYDGFDCEPLVQELLQHGLLLEYEVDGKKYLHIKGFDRHQKVEKKSNPRHPLPDHSTTPPRLLPDSSPSSSGSSLGREGNGMEWNGRDTQSAREEGLTKPNPLEPTEREHHQRFLEIQAAYPKRAGRTDWITAEHHYRIRIDENDATHEELLDAVKRFAAYSDAVGDTGQKWVLAPVNFFSAPDRPWLQEWALPAKPLARARVNGNGVHIPRSLTPGEIIEQAIRDGRSDEEIASLPELDLHPNLQRDIRDKREEIRRAEH